MSGPGRHPTGGIRGIRRVLAWCLVLCCLLTGCDRQTGAAGQRFYYLTGETDIGGGNSLFASEVRQTDTNATWVERIQTYLAGPEDSALRNPFPRDVQVVGVTLREAEQLIEVTLSATYAELTGLGLTLANACLVWTLTEYANVEQVQLYCESGADLMDGHSALTRSLYLPASDRTEQEYTCRIYFADENNRYLIATTRKVMASENLGLYVLYQLLDGPVEEGLQATMPRGTRLLNFTVEDGLAVVNLSEEFVTNRPRTELGERMTIYSLVNSLTELEGIDQVQLQVEGQTLEYYQYMRLPEALVRCETAIGPVRIGINEFDATLYYQSWSADYLAAEPTGIYRDDTKTAGELIVRALLESEPVNGLHNLMPEGTRLLSAETIEGVCYVDLSREFAQITGGYAVERQTVNALVASLCSINSITAVVLTIEGGTVTMPHYDLSHPLVPLSSWFFPS